MLTIRKAQERGRFRNDWLDSRHSFSFGEYHDPAHMGVSVLRVINDDRVIAGGGFATHPHSNMEIVSYVLEGELAHQDNMGNGSVIKPGDVQRMSAGTGVTHSEFNPSDTRESHFLQIWLLPNQRGVKPGYAQRYFSAEQKRGRLKLLVSPDGRDDSISAHSDAFIYASLLDEARIVEHELPADRIAYIHVASGNCLVNGTALGAGDGITLSAQSNIQITGRQHSEVLLFDLPINPDIA